MREVLRELMSANDASRPVVFTALVETRGSTPQKAGACMLVFGDGSQVGTLGGGCVEAEVKRRALQSLNGDDRAELMTFQLDSDYGWDDGLICGGRMTMLVDPLRQGDDAAFYRAASSIIEAGRGCTLAITLGDESSSQPPSSQPPSSQPPSSQPLSSQPLSASPVSPQMAVFDGEGHVKSMRPATSDESLILRLSSHVNSLSDRPRPTVVDRVCYLPTLPRCRLVIVGGGHVGQKVAELASAVDFDVWVIDDRELYCNADRFPQAQKLLVGSIEDIVAGLEIDANTFCIIVTRGHHHDEQALFHLAETAARYVGMIGSRRKIKLIFDDLRGEGIAEEALSRVHAPLGFDIGSQTVPEIAVSIVAELIAERNLPRG